MLNESTDTIITNESGTGVVISNTGVAGMKMSKDVREISFEDYRKDIKPEAFDARVNSAFLSEGWGR
jgi:hypothetical protein